MFQHFFTHLSTIDFGANVISIHDGQIIPIDEYKTQINEKFVFSTMNICDPFVLDHNTSAKVCLFPFFHVNTISKTTGGT
jgi:hypothetical protein